jgi:hypothetical protein
LLPNLPHLARWSRLDPREWRALSVVVDSDVVGLQARSNARKDSDIWIMDFHGGLRVDT